MRFFERYVAVGDSTTEGLDDPDGSGGYRGWANRLAEKLADLQGSVQYANLGVRGLVARQIREQQLEAAAAMRPDLVTVVAGMNDLTRRQFDPVAVGGHVEAMQRTFRDLGATVLTFTLPDLGPVLPLARPLRARARAVNASLREASARTGAILVDFAAHSFTSDPRLWSEDRFHANSRGHAFIAEALAHAIGLPGAEEPWHLALPPPAHRSLRSRSAAELAWWRGYFGPWLWRHFRGRSSADGRQPKRPVLLPFSRA